MGTTDAATRTLLGGRYLLTRQLGAGASATVYLAEDRSLRREVAVKVLRTGLTHDDGFRKRFRAEAVAVAGLNHPHVLRVFDWGEDGEEAWLVTEYLAGGSLRDLLDLRGRLALEQVASIGAQAADGLAYAHERGFVHRDVKPSNLLFDDAGRVRITDFGVARALAEAAWTEPSGGLIGTVRYTSPEQAQGRAVDGKADVYSLALVLYECATGELPFAADSQVATLNARIGATAPDHPALGVLSPVLRDALSPDPSSRLDAAGLFARLTELARTLPEPAVLRGPRHSGTVGFRPPSPEELTGQHRAVGGPRTATQRRDTEEVPAPPRHAATEPTVLVPVRAEDETVVGARPRDDETVVATVPPRRPTTAERDAPRRRWPVVVLVVALVAAGASAWAASSGSGPRPTFTMPNLLRRSSASAQALLARDHATLKIDRCPNSLTVPPGELLAQRPRPGVVVRQGTVVHGLVSCGLPPESIPSVVGMTGAAAIARLDAAHFKASAPPGLAEYSATIPAGHVLGVFAGNSESPESAAYGSRLGVSVSKGRPPVPVPSVLGAPGLTALGELRSYGFVPVVHHEYSRTVHAGNVVSTSPAPGGSLQPGKTILVVVSDGAPATVPSLGELGLSAAEQRIIDAGLTVLGVHGPRGAKGWTTQPPAGTVVPAGSSVTLYARH